MNKNFQNFCDKTATKIEVYWLQKQNKNAFDKRKNSTAKVLFSSKKENLWVAKISLLAFFVSLFLTFFSQTALNSAHIAIAVVLLTVFVALNVFSDMIGLAITSCQIEAIEREVLAKNLKAICLKLVRNSDKVSSILCDVVGDISGILCGVSGSLISIAIANQLLQTGAILVVGAVVTATVASLTVLLKALSKNYAVKNSKKIVLKIAKVLAIFSKSTKNKN